MKIVIKKPVISEKSMRLAKEGLYTFIVDKSARKPLISQAVSDQFGVEVVAVKTANFKPEVKRNRRTGNYFQVGGYKKAIIQLKKGQKIGLFEAEEAPKEEASLKEKKSLLKGTKVKIERGEK